MEILGISRDKRFSPNSVARDDAIFACVAEGLRACGHRVTTWPEHQLPGKRVADLASFSAVFSMARDEGALHLLAEAEQALHLPTVNSARAILRNSRAHLVTLLGGAGIPQPPTRVVDTFTLQPLEGHLHDDVRFPLWVKRGDACAQSVTDVAYTPDRQAMIEAIEGFRRKDIHQAVVVEHAEGDLLKFYGVEGSSFFHSLYPTEGAGFSKFGLEAHNGRARHYPYDSARLKSCADHAARVSGFTVYGGDAIIRPDGRFQIIDVNDWPSFSPCRQEAARAIVQRLLALSRKPQAPSPNDTFGINPQS